MVTHTCTNGYVNTMIQEKIEHLHKTQTKAYALFGCFYLMNAEP